MDEKFKLLKFKIMFLTSQFPNRTNKYSGSLVRKKAISVSAKCDVAVLFVSPDPSLTNKKFEVNYSNEDGLPIIRVYFKLISKGIIQKIFYNVSFLIAHYIGWKKVKKEWGNPDLIHVNVFNRTGYFALLMKYLKKIRYVITENSTPDIDYLKGITNRTKIPFKFLKSLVIKNSEFINVDSNASLDFIKKVGFEGNFGVIKNVVEIKPEYLINKSKIKNDDIKRTVHISNLNESKNVADIIRAFDHICNKLNKRNIEFNIIGEGEQKKELESLAEEFGLLNKNIFFHGIINEDKKLEIITNSDFFILNSDKEGFSCIIAESISYGVPVIATKCGGPEDFVTKEVGILIDKRNLQQLINAIIYMAVNSQNYDPIALQKFGIKNFSPQVICDATYNVYKNALRQWRAGNTNYPVTIEPHWTVLDVGSGHNPNRRANIILEKYLQDTIHRTNQKVKRPTDKQLIVGDALFMPFYDKELDFAIASHIGEHIDDPVKFCSELKRVAKSGYIETPGPLTEFFFPSCAHKWTVTRKANTIYFKRNLRKKPFSKLFYSIFYMNRYGYEFETIKSNNLLLKGINFLLIKIWVFLPYSFMRIVWKDELSAKVVED